MPDANIEGDVVGVSGMFSSVLSLHHV
jgi:hypothetical protein